MPETPKSPENPVESSENAAQKVKRTRTPKAKPLAEMSVTSEISEKTPATLATVPVFETVPAEEILETSESNPEPEQPAEQVVLTMPVVPNPKKISWWRRLFLRKQTVEQITLPEGIVQGESEPSMEQSILTPKELALKPYALKREISKMRREIKELAEKRSQIESSIAQHDDHKLMQEEQIEKLNNWTANVSRTFIWKFQKQLDAELDLANADLADFENRVKKVKTFEVGQIAKFRRSFHKSLTWALLICGSTIGGASIIKFRDQIPRYDWLGALYDPTTSGPVLVFSLVLVVGVLILLSKTSAMKNFKMGKFIPFLMFATLVGFLIWNSTQNNSFMQMYVNPWVDVHYGEILTFGCSIWMVWIIGALVTYYRNWSIFQRDVKQQLIDLRGVIDGYVKTQQEVARLTILYRQATDWLEIIAHSLYRPWKTNPDWGTSKEFASHYDTFPLALRVAQAKEGADAHMAELERIIGTRLLSLGWRTKAFEEMVLKVGNELGLSNGKFTVDLLDHDLPHQTNNSRKLIRRFVEHSAKTSKAGLVDLESTPSATAGQAPEPTDKYLVEVAKTRLVDLIEKTQSIALSAARPRVEQIIDDPLRELKFDNAGIDTYDPTDSWDDFLTSTLGADSLDLAPIGVLAFNQEGRMRNIASNVQSFVVVPRRLESTLPRISSDKIQVVPVGDDKPRPVEMIARVDVVGPVDLSTLTLFESKAADVYPRQSSTMASLEEEI